MPKRLTTADFIAKAQAIHGMQTYSYHQVVYRAARLKVLIDCPHHGSFEQTPNSHLNGSGCASCGYKRVHDAKMKGEADFFKEAGAVHQSKYSYHPNSYKGGRLPITITCPLHGPFQQLPSNHLKGHGCAQCGTKITSAAKLKGLSYFLEKAHAVFSTRYDYSKVELVTLSLAVTIICSVHGEFKKKPHEHLLGQGCPKCSARICRAASRSGWIEVQNGRKAMLYVLELSNERELFYKVGITFNLIKRFGSRRMPYSWRVIARYESDDAAMIYTLEKHLHRQLSKYRYQPSIAFGGHKECYTRVRPILSLLPIEAVAEKEWVGNISAQSELPLQLPLFM